MEAREKRIFRTRHITGWSNSYYNKAKSMPLIERVARPYRKHLPLRQHLAVEIVVNAGAISVLELGCGTGDFAVELMGASKTLKNYLGMAIAESAVTQARENILAA